MVTTNKLINTLLIRLKKKNRKQSSVEQDIPHPSATSRMEKKLSNRKKKVQTVAVATTDSKNLACKLTYDVLSIIFKNLNTKDLGNAARVCRFWSEVAAIEKKVRIRSGFVSLCDFKKSWKDMHPGKEFIDHLKFKPMLHLVFIGDYHDDFDEIEHKHNCPCHSLPSSCDNIVIGNYGIIKDQTELEEVKDKAACLLLPEEPGVTIQTVSEETSCSCPRARRLRLTLRDMARIKTAKCFIILSNDIYSDIVKLLPPRDDHSLAGGIVNCLRICKRRDFRKWCSRDQVWAAILISGPSVESWSVVMRKSCNTKEKVEAKLTLLKDKVKLKKHSVAFMFACQGRGESMFHEKNVESTIFKKLFPDVPLIGTFGGGEFGHCQVEPMKKRVLQYSTVFMIVTYGEL